MNSSPSKQSDRYHLSPVQFLLLRAAFTGLQGLYWTFTGGLAWTTGMWVGWMFDAEPGAAIGSTLGIAFTLAVILGASGANNRRVDLYTCVTFGALGGAAVCGLAGVLLFGSLFGLIAGYVVGNVLGLASFVMRQFIPIPSWRLRMATGAMFGAGIGLVGSRLGGIAGWTLAGAVGLGWMRIMAEFLRGGPVRMVKAENEKVVELSRTERRRYVAQETLRWTTRGAIAGATAAALAAWCRERAGDISLRLDERVLADAEPAVQLALYVFWLPALVLLFLLVRIALAAIGWKPLKPLPESKQSSVDESNHAEEADDDE